MLLWVALWLNGGVSDARVRIILLVTPILAIATLLQLFGLFMCDLVSPEQRVRLGASGFVWGFFIEGEAGPCSSRRTGRADEVCDEA